MPEVVTLIRPERFGSFVVRLTLAGENSGAAGESRQRKEVQAKVLSHFADLVRLNTGARLLVRNV